MSHVFCDNQPSTSFENYIYYARIPGVWAVWLKSFDALVIDFVAGNQQRQVRAGSKVTAGLGVRDAPYSLLGLCNMHSEHRGTGAAHSLNSYIYIAYTVSELFAKCILCGSI